MTTLVARQSNSGDSHHIDMECSIMTSRMSEITQTLRRASFRQARGWFFVLALLALAAEPTRVTGQTDEDRRKLMESIEWTPGPVTGELGTIAKVSVPAGCRFTGAEGSKKFMELTENPTSGNEEGVIFCRPAEGERGPTWFVVYEYDATGYVKDDEKEKLDKKKIFETLKEANDDGNDERRRRGWEPIFLTGWERPPYYDESTHNLTWALRVASPSDTSINHSVRLLGRGGVMKVDLVISPESFTDALPTFDEMIAGTTFVAGQRYSEWRSGDKVAKYGLTALVAGGAGAAAMKLGLFGKLWKVIAAGFAAAGKAIVAAIAAIGAFFKRLFGKREKSQGTTATK